ncbi:MAG: sugar-binding transcriptional regulator, partial [Micrococcales bacterium]|nr:sugar-binding transcriptional regulator [Micrococcales bacterium]
GTPLQRVGALAAEGLVDTMPRRGSIGLSWGSAVQALADALPEGGHYPDVQVLPLVGGLSIVDSARDANVIIQTVAQKLGANSQRLFAPAVVESAATRDAILREPSIRSVLDAGGAATLAVVGVGTVGFGASSEIVDSMHLDAAATAEFLASGAVGDCCTRFFDEDGVPVRSAVDDRVVAIDLESLRAIPTVVGVAAGPRKSAGLRGALRGGLIDVAMVDSDLAESLLA